jgi:hypothetical protein
LDFVTEQLANLNIRKNYKINKKQTNFKTPLENEKPKISMVNNP